MIDAGQKKVTIAAIALAAQIAAPTLGAYARDYGQYEDVPQHIRDWFKALKNPQTGRAIRGKLRAALFRGRLCPSAANRNTQRSASASRSSLTH
jgi:hypothetical protein